MFHGVSRFSKGRACLVLILIVAVGLFWPGGKAWANDPPTPSGLAVANPTPPTGTSLVLTWNAVTFSGHAGASYRIDRRTGGGSYSELTTIANPLAVTYTDTGLSHSLYYYRIRSYDTHGDHSNWSSEVSARPNRPPVFTGAGTNTAQTVAEGAGLTAVAATDPDADTLTYSLQGGSLPAGITLQSTGAFTGTVGNLAFENGPTYTATIRASDPAGLYASTTLTITVTNANGAPSFTGASTNTAQTVAEGAGLAAVAATDPDLDPLTYNLQGGSLPAGITLQADGSFTGTVGFSAFENGPVYNATIRVSDGGLFADTGLVVTVTDTNRAPVYTGAPTNTAQTVAEGAGLTTAVAATDPDLDTLTYSLQSGALPAGITLQSDGSFTGTVSYSAFESGPVYNVTIRVSDGALFADTALAVTVTDTNRSPALAVIGNQGPIGEGTAFSGLSASGTDPDPEDTLIYSISGQPAGMGIHASTGAISGAVGYEAFEDQPGGGHYHVTVTVTDNHAASASQSFDWTVYDVNRSPTQNAIGNQGPTAEGTAFSGLSASGDDPDLEDTWTYSISGQPATIVIDASTGAISGTVGYEAFENQPAHGHYIVTVTVNDNHFASAFQSFDWTVTDTNRAPSLAEIGDTFLVLEGTAFSGLPTSGTDPDPEDALTYSISGQPSAIVIDASTGVISGAVGYQAYEDQPGAGYYTITVTVTDNHSATASQSFTWTIYDTNRSPSLAVIGDQGPTAEGTVFSGLSASGDDPDPEDSWTYSISGQPATIVIDASTGAISGTVGYEAFENQPAHGHYIVTVTVTDNHSATASRTFDWTISDTNRSPSLDAIGNQGPTAEATVFSGLSASGSDPDPEDSITYSISGQPAAIVIDASTGAISGTIGYQAFENQPIDGHYTVTVTVTDNHSATASQSFAWTVTDTNRPPVYTGAPTNTAQTIAEGAGLAALTATDPDSDTLTFTRTGGSLPPGITLQSGGTFSGTANQGSIYSVTIRVSDGSLTATTVLHVTVAAEEEEEAPAPPRVGPPLKTGIVITVVPGSHVVWVNGYPRDLDAPAYFGTPGRMMVPLRFVSETVGAEVLWNPVTQQITIRGDWTTIVLTVGSRTAFVNGVAVRLDAPAVLLNGRVFVPLRFICEALGAQVDYRPSTHSARIQR
jgi:hypothetical protein